jgi:hypothetical protein
MPGCPAPYPYVRPVPHSRATTRCGSLRSTREGNFETHTNRACCRGFASFGGLVGGVSLVCRAVGIGSGGYGRSFSVIDAKLIALRRCENYSPIPVCTILWCRPGG